MSSSSSQPLVSIVTPVYNGADHIAESLESVLAQTHQNWECIVVNNCSTDASAEVARSYAAKDSRIRVHDNEKFLRVIANHNLALRQISPFSKYAKIVFADDLIFPECLEQMVAVAEENPSVGIVGAYGLRGRQVMWSGLPYPSRRISGRDVCRKLFLDDLYVFGTPHSVLFRSDLVRSHDPFYNESNLHADSEACCDLLKGCDFGFVHQILTFTRERAGSLTEFTNQVNTLIVGRLHDLVTHGPDYLTPDEFKACLDRKLSNYYNFLARSLLRGRDKKFWDYHKGKLDDSGVGFSRARLARATLAELGSALLNPKDTVERLLRKRGPRDGPSFVQGLQQKTETR